MFVPRLLSNEIVDAIQRWPELKRWERKEIGQTLRRLGLSYREIAALIPVSKATLSAWCRDLPLDDTARCRVAPKPGDRRAVGAMLRQRAIDKMGAIRRAAKHEAQDHLSDASWAAGVMAYWAEGAKRGKDLRLSNSDPDLVYLFVVWVENYLGVPRTSLTASLHLHDDQDDVERKSFWSRSTGIPVDNFRKTFVKTEGTGHRKNVLYNGTVIVRVPRSGQLLHRVLGWIDALAETSAKVG